MTMDRANQDKLAIFRQEIARVGVESARPTSTTPAPSSRSRTARRRCDPLCAGRDPRRRRAGGGARWSPSAPRAGRSATSSTSSSGAAAVLNKRLLETLIKAGAFDSLHANRRQLVAGTTWRCAMAPRRRAGGERQTSLFGGRSGARAAEAARCPRSRTAGLERLEQELEALGFYLTGHPLDGYRRASEAGVTPSDQLRAGAAGSGVKLAGIVLGKQERTHRALALRLRPAVGPHRRRTRSAVRRAARPRARAARRQPAAAGRGRGPRRRRRRRGPGDLAVALDAALANGGSRLRQPGRDPAAPTPAAARGLADCWAPDARAAR